MPKFMTSGLLCLGLRKLRLRTDDQMLSSIKSYLQGTMGVQVEFGVLWVYDPLVKHSATRNILLGGFVLEIRLEINLQAFQILR